MAPNASARNFRISASEQPFDRRMPQAAGTVGDQRFAVQVSKQNVTHRGGVESCSEESIMDTNFQRAAGQGAAQDGHRVHKTIAPWHPRA